MILYFSGSTDGIALPEVALDDPAIMLTYFEIREGGSNTRHRMQRHARQKRKEQRGNPCRRARKAAKPLGTRKPRPKPPRAD